MRRTRPKTGLDGGDADHYDAMVAGDVLWGSPYGKVLTGYDHLNAAHRSLMDIPTVSQSRYEAVQTCAAHPDVVITHVRRQALPDGNSADGPGFSEMAMYVLVRRAAAGG